MDDLPPSELCKEYENMYSNINPKWDPTGGSTSFSITTNAPSKRKRAPKELLLRVNKDIRWEPYVTPSIPAITLLDRNSLLPIVTSVVVGQIDKSAIVEGDMCGIFRQNQFKLQCILQGALSEYNTPAATEPAQPLLLVGYAATQPHQLLSVDGLFFHLYAFRQSGNSVESAADLVPLHQVGPSRTKKDTQPPELLPVSNGTGVFDKLQFQASTHLSSGTHFRAVVCLMAKVADKLYVVNACISPKFIVHARNPGRCAGKLTKKAHVAGDDPQNYDEPSTPFTTLPSQPSLSTSSTTIFPQVTPLISTNSMTHHPEILPQRPFTSQYPIAPEQISAEHTYNLPPVNPNVIQTPQDHFTRVSSQQLSPPQYTTPSPPPSQHIPSPPHTSTTHTHSPPQATYTHTPSPPPYTQSPPQYTHAPSPQYPPQQSSASLALAPCTPPKMKEEEDERESTPGWQKNGEVSYFYGRVGINTNSPLESLTVNGNIMVTGNMLKPSDYRLKDNFLPVNPAVQLNVINNIRIYDYDINTGNAQKRERGVIAQDVAQLLPSAVHQIGNYTLQNGQTVDNLLVVNDRMLLLENIGATQQLNKMVDEDRDELEQVNAKIEELEEEERKNSSLIMSILQSMSSYVLSEGFREGDSDMDSWIHCGFSLFGLGPAWSLFLLGFICPPVWLLGALYMSAKTPVKRVAGTANCLLLLLTVLVVVGLPWMYKFKLYRLTALLLVVGIVFFFVVSYFKWRRQRIRDKLLKSDFLAKMKASKAKAEKLKDINNFFNVNKRPSKNGVVFDV